MSKPPITSTLVSALSQPVQTSLHQMISEFAWEDLDVLDAIGQLDARLQAWGIDCIPQLGFGDLGTERVLRSVGQNHLALAIEEIKQGESATIEFKETLVLDVDKHTKGGQPIEKCRSDKVILSALKTIAAFLNTGGGTLMIGVSDTQEINCISREYSLIDSKKSDFDSWELFLRSSIEKYFVNGRTLTPSISVNKIEYEGLTFARIVVGGRKRLTFIKYDGENLLYIRDGNRTLSVPYCEIEDFFDIARHV